LKQFIVGISPHAQERKEGKRRKEGEREGRGRKEEGERKEGTGRKEEGGGKEEETVWIRRLTVSGCKRGNRQDKKG